MATFPLIKTRKTHLQGFWELHLSGRHFVCVNPDFSEEILNPNVFAWIQVEVFKNIHAHAHILPYPYGCSCSWILHLPPTLDQGSKSYFTSRVTQDRKQCRMTLVEDEYSVGSLHTNPGIFLKKSHVKPPINSQNLFKILKLYFKYFFIWEVLKSGPRVTKPLQSYFSPDQVEVFIEHPRNCMDNLLSIPVNTCWRLHSNQLN